MRASKAVTTFEPGDRVMVDPDYEDPFFINAGQPAEVSYGPNEVGSYLIIQDPPPRAGATFWRDEGVSGWWVMGAALTAVGVSGE